MTGIPLFVAAIFSQPHLHALSSEYRSDREDWERIETPLGATGSSGFCYVEKCIKSKRNLGAIRLVKQIRKGSISQLDSFSREINALMNFAHYVSLIMCTFDRRLISMNSYLYDT